MQRRLSGLLLIIRALVPFLMLLTLYWGYSRIAADVAEALAPIESIEIEVVALGDTIDTAREQFDAAREDVEAAVSQIQRFRIPDFLPDLPTNLSIPSLDIPTVNVPIVPTVSVRFTNATGSVSRTIEGACRTVFDFFGIGSLVCDPVRTVTDSVSFSYPSGIDFGTQNFQINFPEIPSFNIPLPDVMGTIADGFDNLFDEFTSIFNVFEGTFNSVTALGNRISSLPENIGTIATAGQTIATNLGMVATERAGLVMWSALVVVILLVIYFSVSLLGDLGRGIGMLLGAPPTDPSSSA